MRVDLVTQVMLREVYKESHSLIPKLMDESGFCSPGYVEGGLQRESFPSPSSWMRVDLVAQVMLREVYKESHCLIPKLMDESGSCSPGYVEGGLQRESFPSPSSWMRVDLVAQVMLREVYGESSLIPKLRLC